MSMGVVWLGVLWSIPSHGNVPQIEYLSRPDFFQLAFQGQEPKAGILRLKRDLKKIVEDILGHDYAGRRIRYWMNEARTAWIFDEIGKDLPITIGVVVENDAIQTIRVMVYREERGGEVHQSFFTDQFNHIQMDESGELTKSIDGITGATLSVGSVTRVAKLALTLDAIVNPR